jgi:hypothetical protein
MVDRHYRSHMIFQCCYYSLAKSSVVGVLVVCNVLALFFFSFSNTLCVQKILMRLRDTDMYWKFKAEAETKL